MKRRSFIAGAVAMASMPLAAEAQGAGKVYRIGFLRPGQPPKSFVEAFQRGLRERGYVEGQNVSVEYRFLEGDFDQLVRLAEELVRLNVDVILASGGPAARAAQKTTTAVPIVFVGVYDPVEQGLVVSLAHPAGNATGLSLSSADLSGKRLEALKELVPGLRRVAVLWERSNPGNQIQLKGAEAAARVLGLEVQSLPVQAPEDFESVFRAARSAGALLLLDAPLFSNHRTRPVALAASGRLPAIYGLKVYVEAGGLMSYGVDLPHLYAAAGIYVDKILKGAKPADLPVEQPTKFEFVINLKTAKALGLTIPQSLLLRADEIIQ